MFGSASKRVDECECITLCYSIGCEPIIAFVLAVVITNRLYKYMRNYVNRDAK